MVKRPPAAHDLLSSLADASRWQLVETLGDGPLCVTELAVAVGLSQSCTTRHLQVLTRVGVVERKRAGKRVLFRLRTEDEPVAALLAWIAGDERSPSRAREVAHAASSATPPSKRAKKQGSTRHEEGEKEGADREPAPKRPLRRGDIEDYLL